MNERLSIPMLPLKFLLILVFAGVLTAVSAVAGARASVMPGGNSGWLVVASRPDANQAISVASGYVGRFPKTSVFQSNNGWYAVTIGWMRQPEGNAYKARLIASGAIPGDSYFHNGERFQYVIWSATGLTGGASQGLFSATLLVPPGSGSFGASPPAPRAYVSGLNPDGDNYLSLRTGPGTGYREITRLRENTQLTVLARKGSWVNVALGNGQSGWAYGKYITASPSYSAPSIPQTTPPPASARAFSPPRAGLVGDLSPSGDTYLSLRTGAGTQYAEIARLLEGTEVKMLAQQGAWIEVELDNGMRGWASGRYLAAAPENQRQQQAAAPDIPIIGPAPQSGQNAGSQSSGQASAGNTKLPDLSTLPDGKRVALIMGNSAYDNAPFLPNPKNDAVRLTDALKRLGFTVILGLDQSKVAMESTIRSYVRNIRDADVALFFYAGHAMQMNGKNYLIPIDAKLEDATAVDFETIELGTVLDYMNAPGRLSIALLDACRDNPLSRRFARNFSASRSSAASRGLAAPQAGGGNILIGYATAPGEVALDGDGDNSPFTAALLKHIETPGLEIEIMMKRVKADVYATTGGSQSPWHNSALRREFYFIK
ncbi:caspase family protein [Roseibium sp.]|uniref:caspase family protein n=1 Tax=Roseibium sp. TaxID=1936156 RepID=UPI003D0FAEF0